MRRSRQTAWLVVLGGCGRIGFEPAHDGDADARSTVTAGDNADDTVSGGADTSITMDVPSRSKGTCASISSGASNLRNRSLLRWELATLPATPPVVTAEFELWISTDTNAAVGPSGGLVAFRMLEPWVEGSTCDQADQVNWTERMSGVPWAGVGADPPSSDPAELGSLSGPLELATPYILPLPPALVQSWLDEPATNFGILLDAWTADQANLVSREGVDGQRPRLRITR